MRILFSLLVAAVLGGFSFMYAYVDEPEVLRSVEIGLAEFSPRGLIGGIAVPASGDSLMPPQANIFVRSNDAAWTNANITIYLGDDLDIRWNSQRATQCTGSSAFSTGGAVSGIQTTVTAPGAGTSITYTVMCTNTAGTATDSLTVTARSIPAPQCNDNIDNTDPEDTLIDFDGGGTALPASYNFSTQHPESAFVPVYNSEGPRLNIVETVKDLLGQNIGNTSQLWLFYNDQATANKACEVAGYGTATRNSGWSFSSAGNNSVVKWTGSAWQTLPASGNNSTLNYLTCSVPLNPPGTPDPGCISPTDNDETDGPPTVDLKVKNDNTTMSFTGSNITIPTGNQISLRWNSNNSQSCVGTAFSISPSSLTSGTQSTVTEPTLGNTTRYSVRCTGPQGSATDFLDVTAVAATGQPPTITADPKIVRYGEDTTLTWNTGSADPAECSVSGDGFTFNSLAIRTGISVTTIYAETVFTLSCPLGTASVTVKVLPQVQES